MARVSDLEAARALSDERVVDLVRAGERDLFELIMRRYNQRVYRVVRSFITDEAEVEDVMQQAYLRAFLHLGQLVSGEKVASWLVGIAAHLAIDRLRQRRRLAEDELAGNGSDDGDRERDEMMSPSRGPEKALADRELAALIEAALGDLPEMYRAVFLLREVEGLSTEEVAGALGISEPAVKVRLHRVKEKLRKRLLARAGPAVSDVFAFHALRCDRVVAFVLNAIRSSKTPT